MPQWTALQERAERFRRAWDRTRDRRDVALRLAGIAVLLVAMVWLLNASRSVEVPDVEGMNVHGAVKELNEAGIPFEADGVYGIVIDQWPNGGDRLFRWQDLTLTYEFEGEEFEITGGHEEEAG
ncbi:PASTA domain-containing protein [Demequina sp. TTPB684]|uniref:PASTA domain-containing protein n=1 Tax=unclassified Demequina TaxID=2620311 RepID=UPI001CF4BE8A|nr:MULTISPECIES: PASTA domain-containing protein [unclassified Demequina]MCB2413720.1 PASTA domain-containing protein [Demequina sp. TTPB684]UPU89607.1 PASTA domain-containing protein [Demequina sp. TMPB413]